MRDIKINTVEKEKTFEPINISFTIETKAELLSLWSRLALENDQVNEGNGDKECTSDLDELFYIVDGFVCTC